MNCNSIKKVGITNIGDPFVLRVGDKFFMYATSFIDGFYAWESNDLVNWSQPRQVYKKGARSFGCNDFWAPEVIEWQGKYIMHYTARAKNDTLYIGVAVSDTPMGDFIDVYDRAPMFDFGYAAIDGHVLIDGGKRYLFYSRDCSQHIYNGNHESHLYAVELDETLTKVLCAPTLIAQPVQDWETVTGDFRWNEGAFIVKRDGVYYLMYSSGFYAGPTYSVGFATSKSALGPYVKSGNNPILKSVAGMVSGPGHNCVVSMPDGRMYCVFHAHTHEDNPSPDRQVCICPIEFGDGMVYLP